ncbi:hypothetical protein HQ563_14245 [bacterium]|nr:hypothetical protein [bacterium]
MLKSVSGDSSIRFLISRAEPEVKPFLAAFRFGAALGPDAIARLQDKVAITACPYWPAEARTFSSLPDPTKMVCLPILD